MLNCSKLSSDNANSFLEQLRSLNLIEYEKTGETPVKKTVSYLPKIDHTRADVQIVAQHLNGGQPLPSFIGIPS